MAERNLTLMLKAQNETSSALKAMQSDLKRTADATEQAAKAATNFGASFKAGIGLALGGITTLLGAKGIGALVSGVLDAQKSTAQLGAVLKSTGGAAGITAEAANELASSLSKVSLYSASNIRSAEALLLTFTGIGKTIFPQVTKTALDMSTALGRDLNETVTLLGKALQDPIKGLTALHRVGVTFSEDQTKLIMQLAETGRTAEAQNLILQALEQRYGGSAAAATQTLSGQLQLLSKSFNSIGSSILTAVLPAITPFVTALAENLPKAFDAFKAKAVPFGETIAALVKGEGFDTLYEKINKTFGKEIADRIGAVVDPLAHLRVEGIPKLGEAFHDLTEKMQPLIDKMLEMAKALKDNENATDGVRIAIITLLGVMATKEAIEAVSNFIGLLKDLWGNIGLITKAVEALIVLGPGAGLEYIFGAGAAASIGLALALAGLILPIAALITNFMGLRDICNQLNFILKVKFGEALDFVQGSLAGWGLAIQAATKWVSGLLHAVEDLLTKMRELGLQSALRSTPLGVVADTILNGTGGGNSRTQSAGGFRELSESFLPTQAQVDFAQRMRGLWDDLSVSWVDKMRRGAEFEIDERLRQGQTPFGVITAGMASDANRRNAGIPDGMTIGGANQYYAGQASADAFNSALRAEELKRKALTQGVNARQQQFGALIGEGAWQERLLAVLYQLDMNGVVAQMDGKVLAQQVGIGQQRSAGILAAMGGF